MSMESVEEGQKVLIDCFSKLSRKLRRNLRWHAKQKTRIVCGVHASSFWRDGAG